MDFKTRLTRYYSLNAPQKLGDVDKLVAKYATKEKELFRQLTFKYGPENYLSNADKTAIKSRAPQPKQHNLQQNSKLLNIDEWMDSLLDDNDKNLLREIENYSGNQIPQSILDKI